MSVTHDRQKIQAPGVDARVFRDTLGHYASGIAVISGAHEGLPVGFTCQSFYSVSTDPPLISFSVMRTSTTYPKVRRTGTFAVNVLSRHQDHVSNQLARSGTDKWKAIDWSPTDAGNPVIDGSLMWLECRIWAEHEAGDHLIVVGRVQEMSSSEWHTDDPLIYFKGQYRHLDGLPA